MNIKILILLVCFAVGQNCFQIGDCKIEELKVTKTNIIQIKNVSVDTENLWSLTYPIDGNLEITEIENADTDNENGTNYIEINKTADKELNISLSEEFKQFEKNLKSHSKQLALEKTVRLTCGDESDDYTFILMLNGSVNYHYPNFSQKAYKFNLGKYLEPNVDLTSSLDADKIIITDLDFSNLNVILNLQGDKKDFFDVSVVPDEGNVNFMVVLKVKEFYTITEEIHLNLTVTDEGKPPFSNFVNITIAALYQIGTCTIDERGRFEYGFMQTTIKDRDKDFTFDIDYEGDLTIEGATKGTGAPYINIVKDDKKITFNLTDNFDHFDKDQKALPIQPAITVYKSFKIICGSEVGLTLGLTVEDTNSHDPVFTQSQYTYTLIRPLMPLVDLTSSGDPIQVEDDDFSNLGMTFSVDSPFIMDTFYNETESNKRLYKGILRVPGYEYFEGQDKVELTITATDNGSPPRFSTAKVIIKLEDQ